MKEKIESLREELKYVLDDEFTLIDYLQTMWLDKHTGLMKKSEAFEMMKYMRDSEDYKEEISNWRKQHNL